MPGRMNWLGELVDGLVDPDESILDLGCGILYPFAPEGETHGGRRLGPRHFCVDAFPPYLEEIKGSGPVMLAVLPQVLKLFVPKSWDVVLLLDVVEHLKKTDALEVVDQARLLARRCVIVFTPDGFRPGGELDQWGFHEENSYQLHRCGLQEEELTQFGYEVSRPRPRPRKETLFGVWNPP